MTAELVTDALSRAAPLALPTAPATSSLLTGLVAVLLLAGLSWLARERLSAALASLARRLGADPLALKIYELGGVDGTDDLGLVFACVDCHLSLRDSGTMAQKRYRRAVMSSDAPEDLPLRIARLYRRAGLSSPHAARMFQRAVQVVPDDVELWRAVWETAPDDLTGPRADAAERLVALGQAGPQHEAMLVRSLAHRRVADEAALERYRGLLETGSDAPAGLAWYLTVLADLSQLGLEGELPEDLRQRCFEETMSWCDPERHAPPPSAAGAHGALTSHEREVGAALAQLYALQGAVGRAYPIYLHLVGRHRRAFDLLVGLLVTGAASGHLREALAQVASLHPPEVVSADDALALVARILQAKATCIEEGSIHAVELEETGERAEALGTREDGESLEDFTQTTLAAPALTEGPVSLGPAALGPAGAAPEPSPGGEAPSTGETPFADSALPYLESIGPEAVTARPVRTALKELRGLHRSMRGGDPRVKKALDELLRASHVAELARERALKQGDKH